MLKKSAVERILYVSTEPLVHAFDLAVHVQGDSVEYDGHLCLAFVVCNQLGRRDLQYICYFFYERGRGELRARFNDGKMLLGDVQTLGKLLLCEPCLFTVFSYISAE